MVFKAVWCPAAFRDIDLRICPYIWMFFGSHFIMVKSLSLEPRCTRRTSLFFIFLHIARFTTKMTEPFKVVLYGFLPNNMQVVSTVGGLTLL